MNHESNPFPGAWSYRSLYNDPDLTTAFHDLQLGKGTIVIGDDPSIELTGTIGGPGWSLALKCSRSFGDPMEIRFEGKEVVGGEKWPHAFVGYLVPSWPNGIDRIPAMVGSIVRVSPHSSESGGVSPAGFVASRYAVAAPHPSS
jgi:hypothetical protein